MSKGRLPAILLNADFYTKPRNRRWIKSEGAGAVIMLQMIWIALSQEKDCRLSFDDISAIPFLEYTDQNILTGFLKSCIDIGLLEYEDNFYFNSQIVSDSNKFKAKHYNYSNAAKSREQAKQKQNSAKIVPEFKHDHIDTDTEYVTDIDLNILKEYPQAIKAISRWVAHRNKINKPLDQMAVDSLIMLYQGRYDEIPDDIDHSISNGWKTINAKPRNGNYARGSPPKKSTKDVINEIYEQALIEEQNAKN